MKLRIHHQEIRFRLSPRDIAHLEANDRLQDRLRLSPTVSWLYTLQLRENGSSELKMSADGRELVLDLPLTDFRSWLKGTEIEWIIQQAQPELFLLIEKDLKPNRS